MKTLLLAATVLVFLTACSTRVNLTPEAVAATKAQVERDLPGLAAELTRQRPDRAGIESMLREYLTARPAIYAAAFAPGPPAGRQTPPPALYVHRHGGKLVATELSLPNYNYPRMEWYWGAVDRMQARWTAPYFDVAGGHVWMMTYSVPLIAGDGSLYGVVTNDVRTPKPSYD